jgi:hypothetical protein
MMGIYICCLSPVVYMKCLCGAYIHADYRQRCVWRAYDKLTLAAYRLWCVWWAYDGATHTLSIACGRYDEPMMGLHIHCLLKTNCDCLQLVLGGWWLETECDCLQPVLGGWWLETECDCLQPVLGGWWLETECDCLQPVLGGW